MVREALWAYLYVLPVFLAQVRHTPPRLYFLPVNQGS